MKRQIGLKWLDKTRKKCGRCGQTLELADFKFRKSKDRFYPFTNCRKCSYAVEKENKAKK